MTRCTATAKSTGERCKKDAVPGAEVCHLHGGNAPQVREKAQERLDRMADDTTAEMQEIIEDLVELYNAAPPDEKIDIARELRKNWDTVLKRTVGDKNRVDMDGEVSLSDVAIDLGDTDT